MMPTRLPSTRDASHPLSVLIEPTLQKLRQESRERFLAGRKAEAQYMRHLVAVSRQVGHIVRGIAPDGVIADVTELVGVLNRYADILRPWGESVAARMISDVSKRDAAAWRQHGKMIGRSLREEIENAPTGQAMRKLLAARVDEIASIPREAAGRLLKLTTEARTTGARASEIAAEIMRSGEVSRSHAQMLARTGTSTTATALTRARAEHVGSTHYIWRTSRDARVRKSHREMEGNPVAWDNPPELDGYRAHPGEFANCRCFVSPIIPERGKR